MAKYLLRFRGENGEQTGRMELEGPLTIEVETMDGKVKVGEIAIIGKAACVKGFAVKARRK